MNAGFGGGFGNGLSQKTVPDYPSSHQDFQQPRNRGYGSSNYRPNSNEEIAEARQSLMLLKTKMGKKNSMR